jgi:hypothetical protein
MRDPLDRLRGAAQDEIDMTEDNFMLHCNKR